MYCGSQTLVKTEPDHRVVTPLRCKRWSCETCAPLRQRELKRLARAGAPNIFITLGVNPAIGESPTDRANRLRDAWQVVVRRAKAEAKRDPKKRPSKAQLARHWNDGRKNRTEWPRQVTLEDGKLPFLIVFELTKKGEPHVHIAARAKWVGQAWLAREMGELIGAPVVDVRRVRDQGRVAYYVAKYMGKAPQRFEGCKRYWRSLDFVQAAEDGEPIYRDPSTSWSIRQRTFDQLLAEARRHHWHVIQHPYSAELWPPSGDPNDYRPDHEPQPPPGRRRRQRARQ